MGILNVTPDSFSDGGLFEDAAAASRHAHEMLAAGAAIIDVGGESTRPGSAPVDEAAEIARVRPLVEELARAGACVSVDTRHAGVAQAAIDAGASILNDVSGFRDPAMVQVAASSRVGVVVMHMRGDPATMQDAPVYADVVAEVCRYLEAQARLLMDAGVSRDRIAVDPGIGFGKTLPHNLALLAGLDAIAELGYAVVLGASRKRFIGELTGVTEPRLRLAGSVAAALEAVRRGADVVRVHDVAATVEALAVAGAIAGAQRAPRRVRAFVGLGSNMGDRMATIAAALDRVAAIDGVDVVGVSDVVESEPWGVVDQPPFANAVAMLEVSIDAASLLAGLLAVEASLGRTREQPNGPRTIDLDLLLHGREQLCSSALEVPHPRMLERDFVVTPLLEIAPDVRLPDGRLVADAASATAGRVVRRLGPLPGRGAA